MQYEEGKKEVAERADHTVYSSFLCDIECILVVNKEIMQGYL
jgi:hypothetical protein